MSSEFRRPPAGHEMTTGSESGDGLIQSLRSLAPWLAGIAVVVVAVVAFSWWVIRPRWPLVEARWPELVSLVTRIVRPDIASTPTRLAVQVVDTATPEPPTVVLPTPTFTLPPTNTAEPSATPSATATSSPIPSPTATTMPLTITVGGYVEVFDTGGDGLNVRAEPDASANKVGKFPDGAILLVKDGPQEAGGYIWWQLEDEEKGLIGWSAGNWLKPMEKPESD